MMCKYLDKLHYNVIFIQIINTKFTHKIYILNNQTKYLNHKILSNMYTQYPLQLSIQNTCTNVPYIQTKYTYQITMSTSPQGTCRSSRAASRPSSFDPFNIHCTIKTLNQNSNSLARDRKPNPCTIMLV